MAVGLAVAAIIGALISAGAGIAGSAMAVDATKKANRTNIDLANQNNAVQLDIAKHGLSYRMQDAANAGLNPVFAAQGGPTTPTVNLDRPNVAPASLDLSSVSSAISAMNNLILTDYLINSKQQIAKGYQDISVANNEARNTVLRDLYKRKAKFFNKASEIGSPHVNSAKQISDMTKDPNNRWDEIMKELKGISKYKYKYKK